MSYEEARKTFKNLNVIEWFKSFQNKSPVWKQYLCGGSVFASPVMSSSPHLVISATLAGQLVALKPVGIQCDRVRTLFIKRNAVLLNVQSSLDSVQVPKKWLFHIYLPFP